MEKFTVHALEVTTVKGKKGYIVVGDKGTVHKNRDGSVHVFYSEDIANQLAEILIADN